MKKRGSFLMPATHGITGILAYGSLIDDPGEELARVMSGIIRDVMTPFPVEFARMSASRGNAPTLVPHPDGAQVNAAILMLDCARNLAADMLWRRETRTSDLSRRYPGSGPDRPNAVKVEVIEDFLGCDTLLYTKIGANVSPLTAEHLAELAIMSVRKARPGLDGISYLMAANANGIVTTLSKAYDAAILHRTGAADLRTALAQVIGDCRN